VGWMKMLGNLSLKKLCVFIAYYLVVKSLLMMQFVLLYNSITSSKSNLDNFHKMCTCIMERLQYSCQLWVNVDLFTYIWPSQWSFFLMHILIWLQVETFSLSFDKHNISYINVIVNKSNICKLLCTMMSYNKDILSLDIREYMKFEK
jgi:hypothetical protein